MITMILHYLGHFFTISFGVEGGFCQQDRMLLWGNSKLVVEGVMPDLLHVIPVGDNSMLNRILKREDTSLTLGLVSYVGVLLSHTNHHTLVTRTTYD